MDGAVEAVRLPSAMTLTATHCRPRRTDFSYGGVFYPADSGLYMTPHRAYDRVAGR